MRSTAAKILVARQIAMVLENRVESPPSLCRFKARIAPARQQRFCRLGMLGYRYFLFAERLCGLRK